MRLLVRWLDGLIRASQHVFEFSQDEQCILRLQHSHVSRTFHLPDITLNPGDPVLLLHLWNERLPATPPGGADLFWAKNLLHKFRYSLGLVAGYLQSAPQLAPIRGIGGETILLDAGMHAAGRHAAGMHAAGRQFVEQLGFTVFPHSKPLGRFGEFWENFYSWMIIWTFNPRSLPRRSLLSLRRSQMWISREAFLRRFGQETGAQPRLNTGGAPP